MHRVSKEDLHSADLREHRRIVRITRAAVVMLALLAVGAGLAAAVATHNAHIAAQRTAQARRATAQADLQRLLAQSKNLRGANKGLALLLAVEARKLDDTPASRGAILDGLVDATRFQGNIVDTTTNAGFTAICPLAGTSKALTTSTDGTYSVVDIRRRTVVKLRHLLTRQGGVTCVSSPDHRATAIYAPGGRIWLFDARTETLRAVKFTSKGRITSVGVGPAGHLLAVGDEDGIVTRVETDPGAPSQRTVDDVEGAAAVAVSPSGRSIVGYGSDRLDILDATTGTVTSTNKKDPAADLEEANGTAIGNLVAQAGSVAFSANGLVLAYSRAGIAGEWSRLVYATGPQPTTELFSGGWGTSTQVPEPVPLAFDGSGQVITSDFFDGDPSDIVILGPTGQPISPPVIANLGPSPIVATSGSGALLIASRSRPTISVWHLDGIPPITKPLGPLTSNVEAVSYAPGGDALLVFERRSSYPPGYDKVTALRTNPRIVKQKLPSMRFEQFVGATTIGALFPDGTVGIFDLRRDQRTSTFRNSRVKAALGHASATAFSPGGKTLLVGTATGSVTRFDADGHTTVEPWDPDHDTVTALSVSSRGLVAVGTVHSSGRRSVRMFDLATGRPASGTFSGYDLGGDPANGFSAQNFSADGRTLGLFRTTDAGQVLAMVDVATGRLRGRAISVDAGARLVSFDRHADVALVEGSGFARLYDLGTSQEIGGPIDSGFGPPWIRSDGRQFVTTAGARGTLLWELDASRWEQAACRLAGRNLTAAEWSRYMPNGGVRRRTCPQFPLPN